jgi:23S rRNA (adenine2030-N6)-methyltransferase
MSAQQGDDACDRDLPCELRTEAEEQRRSVNYRHAYHAGNFADVFKHVALVRILLHLRAKPTAFHVLDTHAGAGLYDLTGPEASRTGEWRDGIGRLRTASLASEIAALLAPYLDAVGGCNPGDALTRYPGSPLLALRLMRGQDRLTACELEPSAAAALKHALADDRRAKFVAIDGWVALKAYLPPKQRRGLVLIDPPFERPDECSRLAHGIVNAWRKWMTGTYMAWYPIKDRGASAAFARALATSGMAKILRAELDVGAIGLELGAAGIIMVNPPWRLADELKMVFAPLTRIFARGPDAACKVDWLLGEN